MIIDRPAGARGHGSHGWLDSRHTFSFANYHDADWMGFGPLRVINEDRVQPGHGFPTHHHANMEIVSIVLEGALAHRDSTGAEDVLHAGDVQCMSAGAGIDHSEYNGSASEPVHFLQVWIQPDRVNAPPVHAQHGFDPAQAAGSWQLLVASDRDDAALTIRQDARILRGLPGAAAGLPFTVPDGRRAWLQVTRGEVVVAGRPLAAGDAIGIVDESDGFEVRTVGAGAEVLLFDLPR